MGQKLHEMLRDSATSLNAMVYTLARLGCDGSNTEALMAAIADEIERNYTPKRTCYEAIKDMNFNDLGEFIFRVYNKGWSDGRKSEDDEAVFCCTMLDYPDTFLDEDWK